MIMFILADVGQFCNELFAVTVQFIAWGFFIY